MMNRMEEYKELMSEFNDTPIELNDTLLRAKERMIKSRIFKSIVVPTCSLIAVTLVFIVMVNISPTFAYACEKIPLLNDLASAVKFSPSLSVAVENEYVQSIDLEQTKDDITMRIEYVIVDQKQLNVFYTLSSKDHTNLNMQPSINNVDDTPLHGYTLSSSFSFEENDEIRHFTVDFVEQDMPSKMQIECEVYGVNNDPTDEANIFEDTSKKEQEETKEETRNSQWFIFQLEFDPSHTAQGKTIELNKTFSLDGQTLTAIDVDVYPTHMQLNLADDKNNTAWLKSLMFYVTDENGNRFDTISNGISAIGSADSPMMGSYRMESSFFYESKQLNIHITGVEWIEKDAQRVKVNLKEQTADHLPQGVTFEGAVKIESGWKLTFLSKMRKENIIHQIFNSDYYDEIGKEYSINGMSSMSDDLKGEGSDEQIEEQIFKVQFMIEDYPYDIVYLSPSYSYFVELDKPIVIQVN